MPDYWGKGLPANAGHYNFDTERFEYFRDGTVLVEALKGDLYDFRVENIARNWATAYDEFPAVKEGRLIKEAFPTVAWASCRPSRSTPAGTSSRTRASAGPSTSR